MINVLFVDDEPNIIQALQRMLRPMRHEWMTHFVNSGPEALAFLAKEPCDVIVSDMRMPVMNGAELLSEVRKRYPQMARIVLSGQAEREMILQLTGTTHQYLHKPCNAESLKDAIARSCSLRHLLSDERLRAIVSQAKSLPSLPTLYWEIMKIIQQENASLAAIAEVVARDMAMSAKVLQLTNSAFFGFPRQVSSVVEAVSLLGIETLKTLVLSIHIFSEFPQNRMRLLSLDRLWDHSALTAKYGLKIAKAMQLETHAADDASMAGFLHDIGKLVLALNLPDEYAQAQKASLTKRIPIAEAEREVFGASHAEVAAYLLSLWGLPTGVVEAIAWHHRPSEYPTRELCALSAVHIADSLANARCTSIETKNNGRLDEPYLAQIGVAGKLEAWRAMCN